MKFLVILLILGVSACKADSPDTYSVTELMHIGNVRKEVAIKLADKLIFRGCVNALGPNSNSTVLQFCAGEGSVGCVKKLLRNGADPTMKDAYNKTALDYARENDYRVIVGDLLKATPKTNQTYGKRCKLSEEDWDVLEKEAHEERVDEILGVGLNKFVAYPDGQRETFLITWTKLDWPYGVAALLKAGADATIRDNRNKSAFDYAVEDGNWRIAEMLYSANHRH